MSEVFYYLLGGFLLILLVLYWLYVRRVMKKEFDEEMKHKGFMIKGDIVR